jgi:hypothetical protein
VCEQCENKCAPLTESHHNTAQPSARIKHTISETILQRETRTTRNRSE